MCLCNPIPVYRDGEDIKVYKVVKVLRHYDIVTGEKFPYDAYRSPYNQFGQGSLWKLDQTNAIEEDSPKFITMFDGAKKIEWDAFHSFFHLKDAVKELKRWERSSECEGRFAPREYAVLECVIPANTKYAYFGWFYQNDFGNPVPSYASQSLTPVKELSREELKAIVKNK